MTLVISFDHRLVDGTPAVMFLHRVKELLEPGELATRLGRSAMPR
jgi:pyruvate/2-oxoglutarate dehydrogenase complex dihydrolipoamide acyltransferase (E2) component